MANERMIPDATLVKTLAAMVAGSVGRDSRLVQSAMRLAERLEGRPANDATLRQHRASKARAGRRMGVAMAAGFAVLALAPGAYAADVSYATDTCAALRVQRPDIKRPIHVRCLWPQAEHHFYCPEVSGSRDHRMIDAEAFSEHCADPNATINNGR